MEALVVVVSQNRNQYCGRNRAKGPGRYGSFGSPPSVGFRDISCRTFQYGAGILPTPSKSCSTPLIKRASSLSSQKAPSPTTSVNSPFKTTVKSSAISIPTKTRDDSNKEGSVIDEFAYSELWAGPAYSNSPPPSSLPIPKFSLRPKRTVSLDLPAPASDINFHPIAKSAPSSPTRERDAFPRDLFHTADSATKTLRRILNLDVSDE